MTEDRLERALGGWAVTRHIGERERERMRTAILLTPEVDALWWVQFNEQMARLAARAQKPLATTTRAGVPGEGESRRMGWGTAA